MRTSSNLNLVDLTSNIFLWIVMRLMKSLFKSDRHVGSSCLFIPIKPHKQIFGVHSHYLHVFHIWQHSQISWIPIINGLALPQLNFKNLRLFLPFVTHASLRIFCNESIIFGFTINQFITPLLASFTVLSSIMLIKEDSAWWVFVFWMVNDLEPIRPLVNYKVPSF